MPWGKPETQPDGLVLLDEVVSDEVTGDEDSSCAWCLGERGIVPVSGSHGICPVHRDQFYQSYQASRATRRGRR